MNFVKIALLVLFVVFITQYENLNVSAITDAESPDASIKQARKLVHTKDETPTIRTLLQDQHHSHHYGKSRKLETAIEGYCNCYPNENLWVFNTNSINDNSASACSFTGSFVSDVSKQPDPQRCCEVCQQNGFRYAGYESYSKKCCCSTLNIKVGGGPTEFYCKVVS